MTETGVHYARNKRRSEKRKAKRHENLQKTSAVGWQKYTQYHWFKPINGMKLDYWPSSQKAQFQGQIYHDVIDIEALIISLSKLD